MKNQELRLLKMLVGNISLTILAYFQEMLHVACLDAAEKLGFEISTMLLSDPIVFIMK